MNKRLLQGVFAIAASSFVLTGCLDDNQLTVDGEGDGNIALTLSVDASVTSAAPQSRAEAGDITAADLALTLTPDDGTAPRHWDSVSDFPVDEKFKAGSYTLEASYGSADEEGFGKPYFYGSAHFSVIEDRATEVSLTASLANTMVSVRYTDAFRNYMTSYSATLHSEGGDYINYPADETRAAYLRPGLTTINVAFTKPNGVGGDLQAAKFTAEAKHHYTVTIDVNNGATGDATLVVSFDDTVAQEDVEIDLSDDLLSLPAPAVTASGFTPGTPAVLVQGTDMAGQLKMNIVARGGLRSATLTTRSTSLLAKGWPAEIDLIAASAAQQATLKSLGLDCKGLWNNPDKMAVIDFSNVVNKIAYVEGDTNISDFTLVVADEYSKVNEPVVLAVEVQKLSLSIAQANEWIVGQTSLNLTVNYNGPSIADVTVAYANDRGTWTVCPMTASTMTADGVYAVTITVPEATGALTLQANANNPNAGSAVSQHITISPVAPEYQLAAAEAESFATSARIAIESETSTDLLLANGTFELSDDNGASWSPANVSRSRASQAFITLTGLTPATSYKFRATIFDVVHTVDFSTEGAPQLPNADMETWHTEQPTTKYQIVYYPGAGTTGNAWDTLNELTTSSRGTGNSVVSYGGSSYRAFSGTRSTTDAHSGTAAIIETVGWGKGNTAAGTTVGKCENITAGELYLGSYSGGAQYGMAFNGRPSALTFWYHYRAKNSADYGYAEITLWDAENQVIATTTKNLTAVDSYTKVTMPLTYKAGAKKAAKISVVFKSSGNSDCLSYNSDNISVPSFGNYTDGRYTGSSLYIDDIVLEY